ncbi:ribose-phosphate pyrophosphokinase [Marinobacterium sediminicola]|uniref:ribose-phosphate diphosphokinase n=1 Tax=Marinobacterium sediminicola TaxID=518898 RepID=A0ABY1RY31_9GAMM|nr:ribose-phosphate pyrophosphokinase [Marinobacterium sediminicola]ULG68610.1 ribose-phosphate pyrophosphokinase [Marinobacterium sediminicola]SMR73132.1 ribose-phosphate pyrophosphokinase [Marinobacterium sediminicola]
MLIFNPDSDPALASQLTRLLEAEAGVLEQRRFPDGESYLRIHSDCTDQHCVILCNLFHPDERTLRLLFLADTLRECGARSVGLVTPYLAYMRQDKRFKPGECVSSRPFARLLSGAFDYLVTMDPHLHRYNSLDEIYTIPSRVVQAAPLIAHWIQQRVKKPLLIGPDSESEQWVSHVAELAGAPFQVLQKERRGDYDVSVSLPDLESAAEHTPVLVDDIISSGRTMLETIKHLQAAGLPRAVAIGVHGIFAGDAYGRLTAVADVVTTACIPHLSNQIDIAEPLAHAVRELLADRDSH